MVLTLNLLILSFVSRFRYDAKRKRHIHFPIPPPNPPHRLLIFGKFSNPPYICDQRVYIKCYLHYKTILCHKVVLDV